MRPCKLFAMTLFFTTVFLLFAFVSLVAGDKIARFEGSNIILENEVIKVTLTADQGEISSWIIKATGQELAFQDGPGSFKGLMGLRIWKGYWEEDWPTEIGYATYTNHILQNSSFSALVLQTHTLSEETSVKGLKVAKYFFLTKKSYALLAKYKLKNTADEAIDFEALTIESTANTGPGGRVGWKEHDGAVHISDAGQSVYADFQWIALETETRDALFANYFIYPRPQFSWLFEDVDDAGRDMEPHIGPYVLEPGSRVYIPVAIYGGPGTLDWFDGEALAKRSDWLNMPEISDEIEIPQDFALEQNFPNPFNPETSIRFRIPANSEVVLKIYNALGQEIRTLMEQKLEAGYHSMVWDGRDALGNTVPSGTYFYKLQTATFSQVKRMSLVR
ncbi:MAG: FlgD immunoglobulin-like domain containing protein [bacterium]